MPEFSTQVNSANTNFLPLDNIQEEYIAVFAVVYTNFSFLHFVPQFEQAHLW